MSLLKMLSTNYSFFLSQREDKGVHASPKGVCSKVNVIVQQEFELAYFEEAVKNFSHYSTETPPSKVYYLAPD